jgi:hypothetical protein
MDLNISNLVIEATRKCNMGCEHCLRGNTQRKVISDQYIHKILQLIDNVGTLTVTGGEPTLAMDALDQIENCIRYGNADVGSFYMVTNGKSINIENVANWAYRMLDCCDDNEISGVAFSFDDFHVSTFNWKQLQKQKKNYSRLAEAMANDYGVYESGCGGEFVQKHSDEKWGYDRLISEGRAKDIGSRENDVRAFEETEWSETIHFTESELYLSCSGYIVSGCDWSYDTIDNDDKIRICHIDDLNCQDDLIEAIRAYNKKTAAASQKKIAKIRKDRELQKA